MSSSLTSYRERRKCCNRAKESVENKIRRNLYSCSTRRNPKEIKGTSICYEDLTPEMKGSIGNIILFL